MHCFGALSEYVSALSVLSPCQQYRFVSLPNLKYSSSSILVPQVGDNNVHVREVVGGLKVNAVRCGRFHTMLLVAESELHGFDCEGSWGSWMLSGWRWVCSLLLGRNSGAMVVPAYEAVGQEV